MDAPNPPPAQNPNDRLEQRLRAIEQSPLVQAPISTIAKGVLLGWFYILLITLAFYAIVWGCLMGGFAQLMRR